MEQAYTALKNADAAGDVAAAKMIADYIRKNQGVDQTADVPNEQIQMPEISQEPDIRTSLKRPDDLTGKIAYDLQNRVKNSNQIDRAYRSGEISKPEQIFQQAGKVGAGAVADIAGDIFGSGLKTADKLTGGVASHGISNLLGAVGSLPSFGGGTLSEQLPRDIGRVGAAYQNFSENHPRAAANIESGVNLAAVLPGLVGASEKVIGAAQKTAQGAKKIPIPRSEEIRAKSSELYKLADQQGGVLKPSFMDNFIAKVSSKQPQTSLGKAMEGQSPVVDMIDALQPFKGQPLTLEAAREADEILGDLAYKNIDKFGKLDRTGHHFLDMQTTLRDMIDTAAPSSFIGGEQGFQTVKEARKYWAAQMRMRDVERIIDNAQYFEQPSTAIKTGFRTLLRNGDRLKGYTGKEVAAMKKAATTGIVPGLFKMAGSGLVPIAAGSAGVATGGALGGLAAVPAYAVQQGAKTVANSMQLSRANAVSREIAKRVMTPQTYGGNGANLANLAFQAGKGVAPAAAVGIVNHKVQDLTLDEIMRMTAKDAKGIKMNRMRTK